MFSEVAENRTFWRSYCSFARPTKTRKEMNHAAPFRRKLKTHGRQLVVVFIPRFSRFVKILEQNTGITCFDTHGVIYAKYTKSSANNGSPS